MVNLIMNILLDKDCIQKRIFDMASEINTYYEQQDWYRRTNEPVVVIGVMTGALFFLVDLVRQLTIRTELDLMRVSTYPGQATTAQTPRVIAPPTKRLHDAHILLVDDILDSGKTMRIIRTCLALPYPENIKTVVLLRKPDKVPHDVKADFIGFDIPDEWVAGYGMDDRNGRRREIQHVFVDKE